MTTQECIGTILIVDDSKSVRFFLSDLLSSTGYTLIIAEDGQQGWEMLQKERIDIIISDLEMPNLNGFEFCKRVKSHPEYKNTYFILLSTRESSDYKVQGLELGADDYMGKTISKSELLARVAAGLRIRALETQLEKERLLIYQHEKMASIGQLAAGIAHGVHNPLFAISLNLKSLEEYLKTLTTYVGGLSVKIKPDCLAEVEKLAEELDIDFIIEDSEVLLQEASASTQQIADIVATLKESTVINEQSRKETNIHECLDDAIGQAGEKVQKTISIKKQFSDIPLYACHLVLLNQAFVQLFINAYQAVDKDGEVEIKTWSEDNWIYISISDNGIGIAETDIKRIFDPFFTTRDVGQGPGLGLSVAYDTICNRHQGDIWVNSILGQQTTFTIKLPINE